MHASDESVGASDGVGDGDGVEESGSHPAATSTPMVPTTCKGVNVFDSVDIDINDISFDTAPSTPEAVRRPLVKSKNQGDWNMLTVRSLSVLVACALQARLVLSSARTDSSP